MSRRRESSTSGEKEAGTPNPKRYGWRFVLPCAAGAVIIGTGCFFLGYHLHQPEAASTKAIRESSEKYQFISPLLAVGRQNISTPSPVYASLVNAVNKYVSAEKKSGELSDASVYLIDYTHGGSFAINEKAAYDPASLMKIAIMIAYFRQDEDGEGSLDRMLTYTPELSKVLADSPIDSQSALKVGSAYSVRDLIDRMIIDSDNGAKNLLILSMPGERINEMLAELGIPELQDNKPYLISEDDYSLFFRVLYNATFLSRHDSETALSILSRVTFKDGLVAGLPPGTLVAHKFGDNETVDSSGQPAESELHDCGIVYEKNDHFLLCIMTKGKSTADLSNVISSITKMVSDVQAKISASM